MSKKKEKKFEDLLKELDFMLESLEKGDLSLDDSVKLFEKGMKYVCSCQNILKETEQKVSILMKKNNELQLDELQQKQQNDDSN